MIEEEADVAMWGEEEALQFRNLKNGSRDPGIEAASQSWSKKEIRFFTKFSREMPTS